MHEFNLHHHHELGDDDFENCCKDCRNTVEVIKPLILRFAERIKCYSQAMLEKLSPEALYSLYQILDDLAHLNAGLHLAQLLLKEPEIYCELPTIRAYYTLFFSIHEKMFAKELLESGDPWQKLTSFPLYPRYRSLVTCHIETLPVTKDGRLAFVGCGPVPLSLILMSHLYGIKSIGLDTSSQAVACARDVIKHLGLEQDITILCGDESCLIDLEWSAVLVAALAEPKEKIFDNLREILIKKNGHQPVIFRTYTGMRQFLYQPVKKEDICGFKITREIFPTGRVDNTTVFAVLDKESGNNREF